MTKQMIEAVFLHTRDGRLAAMVDDYYVGHGPLL